MSRYRYETVEICRKFVKKEGENRWKKLLFLVWENASNT
jgi:hypothetical protein